MAQYRIAETADRDLADILEYGIDHFGLEAGLKYYADLEIHFSILAEQPKLYAAVDDIREGYRRSVCGVHSVYYRIEDDGVLIVRVLRSQDIEAIL